MTQVFRTRFGVFYEGETVRYDVYPHGKNILGVAFIDRIETIDKDFLKTCQEEQMAPYCEWGNADDVRKEDEPCP